jgi:hypothetical protein
VILTNSRQAAGLTVMQPAPMMKTRQEKALLALGL